MNYLEVNFDGLVGPLHNYAGLSAGNIASANSAKQLSHPKEAALQGLAKMRWLADRGLLQGFIPPHRRPAWQTLDALGYAPDSDLTDIPPHLLVACCSASAMWTANAGTICPSIDSADQKLHILPANLASNFHRSIEPPTTAHYLKSILPQATHHAPLPATPLYFDEGAANHTRFYSSPEEKGVHLFVYGKDTSNSSSPAPQKFPARQTLEASKATTRLLHIPEKQTIFAQQSPSAIDAGVFHNDVISTGNGNVFLYHEEAFLNSDQVIAELNAKVSNMHCIQVNSADVSLQDAVTSYLFNSQIVNQPDGSMLLLAPEECRSNDNVRSFIDAQLIATENPVNEVVYMDLKQSMSNGGGPACLRLRVTLSEAERCQVPAQFWINDHNLTTLENWVKNHYRDSISPDDLSDPILHQEAKLAFDELEQMLQIEV